MHAKSETGRVWQAIGHLQATDTALLRMLYEVRREMRDSKRKGVPLWGHIAAMGMISGLSALGLIKPETALALLRLIGKVAMGS